jgi:hypothetical protein
MKAQSLVLAIIFATVALVTTLSGSAAAEDKKPQAIEQWPGCDGVVRTIPKPRNFAECMANGPRLNCSREQTQTYCTRKFGG